MAPLMGTQSLNLKNSLTDCERTLESCPGGWGQQHSFLAPGDAASSADLKALMFEGIDKTSLVQALTTRVGVILVRIYASDKAQTRDSDLFGSDLPMEGASGLQNFGTFWALFESPKLFLHGTQL